MYHNVFMKVFNNNADLSGISDQPLAVDEAVQEAFIEVGNTKF